MTSRIPWGLSFLPTIALSMACGTPRSVESPTQTKSRSEPEASAPRESAPEAPRSSEDTWPNEDKDVPSVPNPPEAFVPEPADPDEPDLLGDSRLPNPKKGLPELSMRHIGMHIGGESNSDEAKKPWLKAIEREQVRILLCYRSVRNPMAGGTVGVDLYVGKAGGKPEVRKTRQRLGEADFDDCVRLAFGAIRFPAPTRPTVVSYSLRFDVRDPTGPR